MNPFLMHPAVSQARALAAARAAYAEMREQPQEPILAERRPSAVRAALRALARRRRTA
jgi:hypothetical protein